MREGIETLPDGEPQDQAHLRQAALRASSGFIGLLAGQTDQIATLDKTNNAIEEGWSGMKACLGGIISGSYNSGSSSYREAGHQHQAFIFSQPLGKPMAS